MDERPERRAPREPITCPFCKIGTLRREAREGFLENKLFPLVGYFPWSCYACRKRKMVRDRGSKKQRSAESDVSTSARR